MDIDLVEIKKDEIVTPDKLKAEIVTGEWIGDDDKTMYLLQNLTAYFVSLNTQTTKGKYADFRLMNEAIINLLSPFNYEIRTFYPSEGHPFTLICTDPFELEKFFMNSYLDHEDRELIEVDDLIHFHIDTVDFTPPLGKNTAYLTKNNELMYGRGTCDMKGQAAAAVLHMAQIARLGYDTERYKFLCIITSDEELAGKDSGEYLNHISAQRAIDLEPTGNISGGYANYISNTEHIRIRQTIGPISQVASRTQRFMVKEIAERHLDPQKYNIHVHFTGTGKLNLSIAHMEEGKLTYPDEFISELCSLVGSKQVTSYSQDSKFESPLDPGFEKSLETSFNSNYPLAIHTKSGQGFTTASIQGDPNSSRKLKIHHNFATELTLHLASTKRNIIVASVAEMGHGRHTDKEGVSLKDLTYLVKTLKSLYSERFSNAQLEG